MLGIEPKDLDRVQTSVYQFRFLGYNGVVVDHQLKGIRCDFATCSASSSASALATSWPMKIPLFFCMHPVHLSSFGSTVTHLSIYLSILYFRMWCVCLRTFALLIFCIASSFL